MTRSRAPNCRNPGPIGSRDLRRQVGVIRSAVVGIPKRGVKGPWKTRMGTVRRRAYRLTRDLLANGNLADLEQLVQENGWTLDSPALEENPFHWCLVAIDPNLEIFSSTAARRRAGAELLYADRHEVPELYLIGFIYQVGSEQNIHERLKRPVPGRMVREITRGS